MSISQTTNTTNLNNINDVYKGLVQREYLEKENKALQKDLDACYKVQKELKIGISKRDNIISKQEEINNLTLKEMNQTVKLKELEISKQEELNSQLTKQMKKSNRQRFWSGTGLGLIIGITSTFITLIAIK